MTKIIHSSETGLTPENIPHLIQVMRQCRERRDFYVVKTLANRFAEYAKNELSDIPAYRPNDTEKDVYKRAGVRCPEWDLDIIEAPEGVAGLIHFLGQPDFPESKQRYIFKWKAAANLLRLALTVVDNPSRATDINLGKLNNLWSLYDSQVGHKRREVQKSNALKKALLKDAGEWREINERVEALREKGHSDKSAYEITGKEFKVSWSTIKKRRQRSVNKARELVSDGHNLSIACKITADHSGEDEAKLFSRVEKPKS